VKTLTSTEFKAKCLSILDEVAETGEPVTILKRGKPVAQLVPPVPRAKGYPQEQIIGTVRIKGYIVSPPLPADAWEAERRNR
jgi:prevent-host-death family protein